MAGAGRRLIGLAWGLATAFVVPVLVHEMAASVMNIVPLVILFLVSQKFLVRGAQLGAVKV